MAISIFLLVSCTKDFEETNENNNAPEVVSPDLILPYAIKNTVNYYWGARDESLGMMVGNQFPQHWASIQYADVDRYLVPQNLISTAWAAFYIDGLANFNDVENLGIEMDNPNYIAVSKILKSWTFSLLTDIWGDIPYSEALDTKVFSPNYDTQNEVYAGIIKELKEANDMIVLNNYPIKGDILLSGDMLMWKKFANSLSIRLLNRIYHKPDALVNVNSELNRILSDPTNYPILMENSDNIQLNYLSTQPNTNPIYVNRISRDDFRMSKTLVDLLNTNEDRRVTVFANPAELTGEYVGIPNGLPNAVSLGLNKTSKVGSYFTAAEAPAVIISYSEILFIKAELGHRGLSSAGDTSTNYINAIKASFEQYDLEPDEAFLYEMQYKGDSEGYTQILTQKWLALFGQGLEAWTEQRRTNIPKLVTPEASINNGIIPTRLPYPLSEEALNNENFKKALTGQGGENDMKMKLWWAKN